MAKRTDLPKIPAKDEPTVFNHGMSTGAFWGAFLGSVVPGGILLGGVAGGLIGGFWRKDRLEQEKQEGKTAQDPTFWNQGIFTGYWKGKLFAAVAFAVGAGAMFMGAMVDIGSFGQAANLVGEALIKGSKSALQTIASGTGGAVGSVAFILSGLAAVGSFIYCPIAEGFARKDVMRGELNQALEIQKSQQLEQSLGLSQSISQARGMGRDMSQDQAYMNSTTPDDYAVMQSHMRTSSAGQANFKEMLAEHAALETQMMEKG